MAEIVPFPSEAESAAEADTLSNDMFLIEEGLDLLADFRAIADRAVRDSIRDLVKSMASSSCKSSVSR